MRDSVICMEAISVVVTDDTSLEHKGWRGLSFVFSSIRWDAAG